MKPADSHVVQPQHLDFLKHEAPPLPFPSAYVSSQRPHGAEIHPAADRLRDGQVGKLRGWRAASMDRPVLTSSSPGEDWQRQGFRLYPPLPTMHSLCNTIWKQTRQVQTTDKEMCSIKVEELWTAGNWGWLSWRLRRVWTEVRPILGGTPGSNMFLAWHPY